MSVASVPLAELASINPPAPKLLPNEQVSFLPMADASEGGTVAISAYRAYSEVKTGYTGFETGDILVAKVTPCFENNKIVRADLPTKFGFGSTEFHVVRPGANLDARFLLHFLRQDWVRVAGERRMTGSGGQRRVPKAFLENLAVPGLSVPEQRRIAAILDQADKLRCLRRQSLSSLGALKQSIFDCMFGRVAAPKNLTLSRLANLAELINGDRSSNYPSGADITDVGIPFLSTTNIRNGELDLTSCNFITKQKFAALSRGKLARNDIIITLRGTLGQCALFDCEYETGFINAQMMIIRCSERVVPRYLQEYLSLPSVQSHLKASNSGTAVPQLTAAQMKELEIVVPEPRAQREFVRRFDRVDGVFRDNVGHLNDMDNLFASLQHRAFREEL